MSCYLCRSRERISYLGYYCANCKKIQDLLSVYDNRVYQVLENVLTRTPDQAKNKLKAEIKNEIDNKQTALLGELKDKIKEKNKKS